MTSSFTNLVLAARSLAGPGERSREERGETRRRRPRAARPSAPPTSRRLRGARTPRVVYLGSGGRLGAAHESALKMLESNGGRVVTMADSFLGLRHGPMAAVGEDSLIVAFLSSDPVVRAYERDVLLELAAQGSRPVAPRRRRAHPAGARPEPEDVRIDVSGGEPAVRRRGARAAGRRGRPAARLLPLSPRRRPARLALLGGHPAGRRELCDPCRMNGGAQARPGRRRDQRRPDLPGVPRLSRPPGARCSSTTSRWSSAARRRSARWASRGSARRSPSSARSATTRPGTSAWTRCARGASTSRRVVAGSRTEDGRDGRDHVAQSIARSSRSSDRSRRSSEQDVPRALFSRPTTSTSRRTTSRRGCGPASATLFREARAAGLTTSLDPGFDPSERWEPDLLETLTHVDVFFPNEVELRALTRMRRSRGGGAAAAAGPDPRAVAQARRRRERWRSTTSGRPVHVPGAARST